MLGMTGSGEGSATRAEGRLRLRLSTWNKRGLELRVSLPDELAPLEPGLRQTLTQTLGRGAVQVSVTLEAGDGGPANGFSLNEGLAREALAKLQRLNELLPEPQPLALAHLLALPGLFTPVKTTLPLETLRAMLDEALAQALPALLAARRAEGATLAADLDGRLGLLEDQVATIAELAPRVPVAARDRLRRRLMELAGSLPLAEDRLVTELVAIADRCDVTEELTRLRHHLAQARELLAGEGQAGRRLDFMIQEIQREINTLGAKANDLEMAQLVVSFKAELERLREQAQNLE